MAIAQRTQSAQVPTDGTTTYDSGVGATVVRDVFQDTRVRGLFLDNTAVAAVRYLQMFDAVNPSLGTDFAWLNVYIPASVVVAVIVQGDEALLATNGISYAVTDDPKGSSLTGAAIPMSAFSE